MILKQLKAANGACATLTVGHTSPGFRTSHNLLRNNAPRDAAEMGQSAHFLAPRSQHPCATSLIPKGRCVCS